MTKSQRCDIIYIVKGKDTLTDTTAEVIKTEKRGIIMTNYTITKENGITKISASAKSEVNEVITKALADAFGSENVAMARTGRN